MRKRNEFIEIQAGTMNKEADYHSALLLNNIGVLLLEQGSYKQAACALRDSLKAMKKIFNGRNLTSPAALDLGRKVQQARKHIQYSGSSDEKSIALTFLNNRVIVGKQDQTRLGSLQPVAIHIPEVSAGFTMTGRDPHLEMSVIFNNTGISLYLLCTNESTLPSPKSVPIEAQEHALKMMTLASKVVSNRFALCDDMDEESRIMSVALIVTGNTIQICQATGRASDAKLHTDKYQRLCLALHPCSRAASTA